MQFSASLGTIQLAVKLSIFLRLFKEIEIKCFYTLLLSHVRLVELFGVVLPEKYIV